LLEGCPIVSTDPGIRTQALLACEPFGPRLHAAVVGRALAAGLLDAGRPQPLIRELAAGLGGAAARQALEDSGFDADMLSCRAVVLAVPALAEHTLAAGSTFEIATRARQSGVPCYAVTATDELDAFDARVLDLQLILRAGSARTLRTAGARLGAVI
jgi:hypothetical protein